MRLDEIVVRPNASLSAWQHQALACFIASNWSRIETETGERPEVVEVHVLQMMRGAVFSVSLTLAQGLDVRELDADPFLAVAGAFRALRRDLERREPAFLPS